MTDRAPAHAPLPPGTLDPHESRPAAIDQDEWQALEGMARTLVASGEYQVVRRLRPIAQYTGSSPAGVRRGVILDVETTGRDPAADRVIELGLLPFTFDAAGVIYDVFESYQSFEDPGAPIPADVQALTGITDEMVRGATIDDGAVTRLMDGAVLVIAHNAGFDRPFVERRIPQFADVHWACSQRDVDWDARGCRGTKLDYLLWRVRGCFHDGHRAVDDCRATLHLLAAAGADGQTPFAELLASARKPRVRIAAERSPFETKDALKTRGYRWDADAHVWHKEVARGDDEAEELAWLVTNVYGGGRSLARVTPVNPRDRYSGR